LLGWLPPSDRLPIRASPEDKAATVATAQPAEDKLDRTVLPIEEPQDPPITEMDARNAQTRSRFEVKALQGAPKVALLNLEGYSDEEIARSLDCSLRTVERKLEVIRERWTAEGTP
jgi:DNA-directed RNA polymerase specialized sigma24 family protein